MSNLGLEPWEPEETAGKLWHAYASRLDAPVSHDEARVRLEDLEGRLQIFFHGLGAPGGAEIKGAAPQESGHRLSWRRRLGTPAERLVQPSWDGEALRLPASLAVFPERGANAALYFWLAAAAVQLPEPQPSSDPGEDPLRADIQALRSAAEMTRRTLAACPGLVRYHRELCAGLRAARRPRDLPRWEAAVEATLLCLLGGPPPADEAGRQILELASNPRAGDPRAALSGLAAPRGYRPFEPVILWPRRLKSDRSAKSEAEAGETPAGASAAAQGIFRARRAPAEQAERKDSLILYRFEAILSLVDFLNLNRLVDDDEEETAKKAAEEQEDLTLGQVSKAPATRLKLHLDLSPEDVDRERLSGIHTYPEWDQRAGAYLADHCRVLASDAPEAEAPPAFLAEPRTRRRIRAVRRQFEALRPRRIVQTRQIDGEELDLEAAIRGRVELSAIGRGSDRIWRSSRQQERDLAVSILLDVSRSTESVVAGRPVIDIEREALIALAWGLDACGDEAAIHAFSSLRRDRVFLQRCKTFEEPMGSRVEARIAALKPGFYTRIGAAVRHLSAGLAERARQRRLLLIITDGKPNDLDHYEGRHGVEDSRMAIREARRLGQSVYGVTVDAKSQAAFARIFGPGGFTLVPHPDRLTEALPRLYRHLVAG